MNPSTHEFEFDLGQQVVFVGEPHGTVGVVTCRLHEKAGNRYEVTWTSPVSGQKHRSYFQPHRLAAFA